MDTKLKKKITDLAINVFDAESRAIDSLKNTIGEGFTKAIELIINAKGKAVITGIGKSAIIAQKISATFNSTGQTSVYMHAVDALHGDLGILDKNDVLICLSKSGNSPEIVNLLPYVKEVGSPLIAITGNIESALAKAANCTLDVFVEREACINNLAPTSSTTTAMVMGDALAVCLMDVRNFDENDFARNHPSGTLGKIMLLKVADLYTKNAIPSVSENDSINQVILEITSKRLGATAVLNCTNELAGIITDGDLRRMLEKHENFSNLKAKDIMGKSPKTIEPSVLGTKALSFMREHSITQLIVSEDKKLLGFIHLHDLLKEGLT
ncbi:KpsF/GutQ family sugar-phosphate isomerase [Arcticibacterium luteifluviistationis]|uniref:D-arabinose 5-phosphate isomerase n=1 Tax=Arcticibacterium luteifluviistationis TaxID=1784714 RepID=A0A2Z4G9Q3_9BACT|nr:KpsF/GutQ family sugar-phosphate isomerase [Arcticibacterium luteifluviistationis]AWV97962.1 D-arabinose 5-phosphate isomerase [Arcticibacterium luteifluviistationis]